MICRNNQEGSNVGALHDPTVAPSGGKIVFWEVRESDSIGYEGDLLLFFILFKAIGKIAVSLTIYIYITFSMKISL